MLSTENEDKTSLAHSKRISDCLALLSLASLPATRRRIPKVAWRENSSKHEKKAIVEQSATLESFEDACSSIS